MSVQNKEKTKTKKNPTIGILLGIGFMILGIAQFFYPELAGPKPDGFVRFLGLILFVAGSAQVLYIAYQERVARQHGRGR